MIEKIKVIKKEAVEKIDEVNSLIDLENLRNLYISKKGEISKMMAHMRNLDQEEKKAFGKEINIARTIIEDKINLKIEELKTSLLNEKLVTEKIDITMPGYDLKVGSIHPLNQVIEDLEDFFIGMGYNVMEGPEVESDYYNFIMMNFPKDHPARDMQDSFYVDENNLLRTHTSPVQARAMENSNGMPLKIICPGKTYRRDYDDLTHSHQFMQVEGLVIDEGISFANLKDTLLKMIKHLFGEDREIRLRPSYFPFTEPSVEVDVVYNKADGTKGYIEVLGAGLVHPNVLKMGGYDPNKFSGFAFGIGVERIAMLKHDIDDIRNFYTNDIKFLDQFKGDIN
ncbi:MAG TPA: phenylalanine--tRNA ligase subunit alpha [Acholeplasmataceae bacterium]|nr:phenylalanine--tRNA ligase subunit alpha [Acholeplasmataceae bacterium]